MTLDGSPAVKHLDVDCTARSSTSCSSTHYSPLSHGAASPGWTPDTLPDICNFEVPPPPPTADPAACSHSGLDPSVHPPELAVGPSEDKLGKDSSLPPTTATVSQPVQQERQSREGAWQIGQQFATPATVSYLHAAASDEPKPKRGRGRPRKFPLQEKPPKPKGVKNARSKTGCLTCRRRKKKCDETKPTCINCRKNGKACEGYPDPATLAKSKSGKKPKEKSKQEDEETLTGAESSAAAAAVGARVKVKEEEEGKEEDEEEEEAEDDGDEEGEDDDDDESVNGDVDEDEYGVLNALNELGLETDWAQLDRRLEQHFNRNSDSFFPPWSGGRGQFFNVMIWLAQQHQGVRHGLLCLSAQQLLKQYPDSLTLQQRYMHHLGKGVEYQLEVGRLSPHSCEAPNPVTNDAYTALALIFCLANEMSGAEQVEGFMLPHYNTVVHMAHQCPQKSPNLPFQKLLEDFFYHHNLLALVTSVDQGIRQGGGSDSNQDFKLPEFVDMAGVTFFGGANGLWVDLSHIHAMRERMRRQRQQHESADWPGDMETQFQARALEASLINEPIAFEPGTWQHTAASLYRLSTLIYLYRTIMPSRANRKMAQVVDQGIEYLQQLVQNPAAQGVLLMPLFLLGCASFEPAQRRQVELAFCRLVEQRGDGNVQRALNIVRAVWNCMDSHDDASWDWEALGHRMGCALIVP